MDLYTSHLLMAVVIPAIAFITVLIECQIVKKARHGFVKFLWSVILLGLDSLAVFAVVWEIFYMDVISVIVVASASATVLGYLGGALIGRSRPKDETKQPVTPRPAPSKPAPPPPKPAPPQAPPTPAPPPKPAVLKCPKCGKEYDTSVFFCDADGTKLQ